MLHNCINLDQAGGIHCEVYLYLLWKFQKLPQESRLANGYYKNQIK